ncbi:MAG: SIR2 family protein [Bacteroidota bacterium]
MTNNKSNTEIIASLRTAISQGSNRRVVAIVGAGMSFDAANLPLGKELAQHLIRKLDCDRGQGKIIFEKKINELERKFNLERDDFKTILFALNQMDSKSLMHHFQSALSHVVPHSNSYKLLSALVEKGIINAVLNFNFDEILDSELDKIRKSICAVVTDSDLDFKCPRFPLYIKPHGTVSRPETIRFARADYYRIEPKVEQIIRDLLTEKKTIILLIGFRLKFFDFTNIFYESLVPGSEIFVLDPDADVLDGILRDEFFAGQIKVDSEFSLSKILGSLVPDFLTAYV